MCSPWNPGRSATSCSRLDFDASSPSSLSVSACIANSNFSTLASRVEAPLIPPETRCCRVCRRISATALSSEKIHRWFLRTQRVHGSVPSHFSLRLRHSTHALDAYLPLDFFCDMSGLPCGSCRCSTILSILQLRWTPIRLIPTKFHDEDSFPTKYEILEFGSKET